jgi:hypothetical protein
MQVLVSAPSEATGQEMGIAMMTSSISAASGAGGLPPLGPQVIGSGSGDAGGSNDPFGPAVIMGPSKPKTVFVVYTPQATLSGPIGLHPEQQSSPAPPGAPPAPINPLHVNPIYGPVTASPGAVNLPDRITFSSQGETVRQVTLNANTGAVRIHYRVVV